jgi:hypothetical protein
MALNIQTLEQVGSTWMMVDADGHSEDFAFQQDCTTIFIERGDYWEEVYCGEVTLFQGEIRGEQYMGPAIEVVCGGKKTGVVIPVPNAILGKWYAVLWHERDVYWALASGMRIRIPQGMDYIGGTFDKRPMGKCVCTILRDKGRMLPDNLGRVAMDMADMPFPRKMWFFDGEDYQESELGIYWQSEEIDLTRKWFGEITLTKLFWLT